MIGSHRQFTCWRSLLIVGVCLLFAGCSGKQPSANEAGAAAEIPPENPASDPPSTPIPAAASTSQRLALTGIENGFSVCDGIISGGQPEGDEAFADLARRGVKTIVSVDGARPDVEAAKRAGLQYVHIPVGYNGIPEESQLTIARVIQERPGPYFFHCHHGKHRGPAAAAVAAISAGKMEIPAAVQYLKDAGTGKEYAGLWKTVEQFQPAAANAAAPELVEVVEVESLTAAMVDIDHLSDNLKLCEKAKWKTPPGHSDVEPAQQALLLKEAFRESARHLDVAASKELGAELLDAETLAAMLEATLKSGKPEAATAVFARIQSACKACHEKHRN